MKRGPIEVICDGCSAVFTMQGFHHRKNVKNGWRNYCNSRCKDSNQKKYIPNGENHHNYGRKASVETRLKMSNAQKGIPKPPEVREKISEALKRYKKTPEHIENHRRSLIAGGRVAGENNGRYGVSGPTGKDHFSWKGGVTPFKHAIRTTKEWSHWRLSVYERDDFTCLNCGDDRGGNLEAHHIRPVRNIPNSDRRDGDTFQTWLERMKGSNVFDVDNGVTLCKTCHQLIGNCEEEVAPSFEELLHG